MQLKTRTHMKLHITLIASALVCSPAFSRADHVEGHRGEKFQAHETSLDLFGSVSVGQETINDISSRRVRDDGRLGAGVGANHFFTRELGVGLDAYTENTKHSFVDSASASLIYRFPFEAIGLAPYLFGGGGRQFDATELWFGQAGAGLEFRFTQKWGLFTDARYVLTDGTRNYGLGRLGVRLKF